MTERLVIIGNGMAAARLTRDLLERAPAHYAISIIGEEPGFAYNRVQLSSFLAGTSTADDLALHPAEWWGRAGGVEVYDGVEAISVERDNQVVVLSDGRRIPYSKLVFATGSRALRLPIQGADLPQVHVFRTRTDVERLAQLAADRSRVAVIGGGLLGIEAAYGLAKRGARVTLVHIMDRLMERQLDQVAASMVRTALEKLGIEVLLEAKSESVAGQDRVEGLRLADGRTILADAIAMAAGIKPNAELAKAAGLTVNRGIVVDGYLETSADGIYAVGECAEIDSECCGLVEPAYAQAEVLAQRLSGVDGERYVHPAAATNLKVSGLPVFSAGNFLGGDGTSAILLRDPSLGLYKKFITRNGFLEGAVLVGDTSDAAFYLKLIRERIPISPFRSGLAFGEAYCSVPERMAA